MWKYKRRNPGHRILHHISPAPACRSYLWPFKTALDQPRSLTASPSPSSSLSRKQPCFQQASAGSGVGGWKENRFKACCANDDAELRNYPHPRRPLLRREHILSNQEVSGGRSENKFRRTKRSTVILVRNNGGEWGRRSVRRRLLRIWVDPAP